MNALKFIDKNAESLAGKTVAIVGSTGDLLSIVTKHLALLSASFVFVDRNREKSERLKEEIIKKYPDVKITLITCELEDVISVKKAAEELQNIPLDYLLLGAGAYAIPKCKCQTGFGNVFEINFLSQYYIARSLYNKFCENGGRVIAVSSIAYRYSKTDENDIDFYENKSCEKVYGNSKRYLTLALHGLFKEKSNASLSVVHHGVTFTNITAHYPKLLFAIIKYPMKIIFMSRKKAALSILAGFFSETEYPYWIGPRVFDVWGYPKRKRLKFSDSECERVFLTAERLYEKIKTDNA